MKKTVTCLFFLCTSLLSIGQVYNVQTVIDSLSFPVAMDFAPDGRLFITEKGNSFVPGALSRILVFDAALQNATVFYDLTASTFTSSECGLLGIALDPAFTANHFVYIFHTYITGSDRRFRIMRFTELANTGTSPTIIYDGDAPDLVTNHVGGNLHFRPSDPGHIYFTIGELMTMANAQDLTNPFGKVLRIGSTGTIPADNPFYDDGNPLTGNCDLIWSYGHRNPFDFCFGQNDSLYISENGAGAWDEVDLGHKGANYGWPACEGAYISSSTTVLCNTPAYTDPIAEWSPTVALTGIIQYNGTVMPALDHHLLVADFMSSTIHNLTLGHAPAYDTVLQTDTLVTQIASFGLAGLRQGPEGCVYALSVEAFPNGKLISICPDALSTGPSDPLSASLRIAPNPSPDQRTLSYTLRQPADVTYAIIDQLGRVRYRSEEGTQTAGPHEIVFSSRKAGLPAGLYTCLLQSGAANQALRFIVTE